MANNEIKRVLCFGDSNTWGCIPVKQERYAPDVRWTGVAQRDLGEEYCIIEAGINGRTTVFDDPFNEFRNGSKGIAYTLLESNPLDLIVFCLGTNDLKYTDANGASKGLASLILTAMEMTSRPSMAHLYVPNASLEEIRKKMNKVKILVVSPILVHPELETINPRSALVNGYQKSLEFAKYYKNIASVCGAWFLDAAQVAEPSVEDGVHMTAESHIALGHAVAEKIKEIFSE